MKCCANCFWGFTQEDEDNLEGYEENDLNKPVAGDCLLGRIHNNDYYCEAHQYIDGMEEYETIILFDNAYLGEGYFIIQKLDNDIIRFMKISAIGENGFLKFYIRAYEKDSYDSPEQDYRKITFPISSENDLYYLVKNLSKELNDKSIKTIDSIEQGLNCLKVNTYIEESNITLYKDIYGVKQQTDFIDIFIGDNDTCEHYLAFLKFYNGLSQISKGELKKEEIKKLLLHNIDK